MTEECHRFPEAGFERALADRFDETTGEVVRLAAQLCAVPSVTVPPNSAAFDEVRRAHGIARDYAARAGLEVRELEPGTGSPYPFLLVRFEGNDVVTHGRGEVVALIGHLDVVPAREDDQFRPFLRGVDLHARGAADMKTVVATYLVWMASVQARGGPKPPFVLLLSSCEENGSHRPHHTRSALRYMQDELGLGVRFAVVGERTGELESMGEDLVVGPICRENRSWRWARAKSRTARGLEALRTVAEAIARGRETIRELNRELARSSKRPEQPGVRSGFVNPFARIAGDEGIAGLGHATWVVAEHAAGTAIHSAAAKSDQAALVERLWAIASQAVSELGEARVRLAGVEIGEDENFNSYDGSGRMTLVVADASAAEVEAWVDRQDEAGISVTVSEAAREVTGGPTVVGMDIREVLDHKQAVEGLLAELPGRLWGEEGLELPCNRPPWRCPADQPDLVALEAAYEAVIGARSPDLVKLHGNDGGDVAALQQAAAPELSRQGLANVVVFGQVGKHPHGAGELHRLTSISPYWEILERWAASYVGVSAFAAP